MRTITTTELKAKALEYYNAQRLTAQTTRVCELLSSDGSRCAIGASMTDKEIAETGASIVHLMHDNGIVKFEDPYYATDLQQAHDHWCQAISFGPEHAEEGAKAAFLELLK